MAERLLTLDDVREINSPDRVAKLFSKLGYDASASPIEARDLELSDRNTQGISQAYLVANVGNSELQILLFGLHEQEWVSPSVASNRMKSIASGLSRKPTEFLLLATRNFDQLMMVNPRKTQDENKNVRTSIRKLLLERTNPTPYDRDRLEAIAYRGQSPQELYKIHCEAFDVTQLTKSFYKGYKALFEQVQKTVKEHNPGEYFQDPERLHQFSQRLLGRIMFLYFLQKKEFLAGDRHFLTTQYKRLKSDLEQPDYYRTVLEPLFFETLNQPRPNLTSSWGKIPYLNGGLFDRDYGLGIKDTASKETPAEITLPNALFDLGTPNSILGFFNGYNFTVAENIAGDEDVAVDPEMLGKVFENMLAAEERGQSGSFYTPRSIVLFMCVEVLTRYLADECDMDIETVREIIEYDSEHPDEYYHKLISPTQVKRLKKALENLRCLDPAVGSGAFPLGMMQVILGVKQSIARREGITVQRGSLTISQWKREIIANNLYGVDIKPEAVEIAKLRMWLSLVVDIPNIDDVEPLPNLDYKLMCGDSLISTIHGEQLISDPTKEQQGVLAVTPIQQAIQPLLDLQHSYFDIASDERLQLREQILQAEANIFKVALDDRLLYWLQKQKELERKIKQLKGKISKVQEKEQQEITRKLAELDKLYLEISAGERSLNFFQYHLHFRDVFLEKGGFDIVIGNPPYVRQEQIKELKPALQAEYECYTGVADLYVYFYERGLKLLKPQGHLSYITSNKYFRAGYGEKLRQFLATNSAVKMLIDFGDAPVFEAIAYPSIILVSKSNLENNQTSVLNWSIDNSVDEFNLVYKNQSFYMPQKELTGDSWRLESSRVLRLIDKLRSAGTPLGEYVEGKIYYGIKTGFNEAFVVDRKTRDRLINEHESSVEVLKPFLRGRDVKRWCVDFAEQYLIKIESSENKEHSWSGRTEKEAEKIFAKTYPAIYARFETYRDKLIKRDDQGKYFWELRSCKYWREFEKPKIILGRFMEKATFAFDKNSFFHNDALYMIPGANEYVTAILNSSIGWYFSWYICTDLQNGYIQAYKENLFQIPIPPASETDKQTIENLVQKCLDVKGQGVEEYEAEIDDRVGNLYGLTEEEMKVIRGEE